MNYQTATDEEINIAMLNKIYFASNDNNAERLYHRARIASGDLDYCNNPADMMPVVFDYKISLEYDSPNEWHAYNWEAQARDKNPMRAAAVCYLLMENS